MNTETTCPNCGDTYSEASQLRPKWSDYYDNIVCTTCAEEKQDTPLTSAPTK